MKKVMYSIIAGIAVSATTVFAAEKAKSLGSSVATVSAEDIERSGTSSVADLLNRVAVLEGSAKKSGWAGKIAIKGDVRYRYENIEEDDVNAENRHRIRARLGAYAKVNDATTAGIRISTRQDANSGNETIGDEFEDKEIFFDLAYITVAPEDGNYGAVTLGKMKYPWKNITDMLWDSDINPEGLAYTYAREVDETDIFSSIGYFKIEEDALSEDLNLMTAQIGVSQALTENSKITLGASYYGTDNAEAYGEANEYQVAQLFGELSLKDLLPVPFKVYGDFANNSDADTDEQGYCFGVKFGDAKKGKWEAKVGYRDLDQNVTFDGFADSDYAGGAGAGIKGTRLKAKYNIYKNLQAGFTYVTGEDKVANVDADTIHVDFAVKF